MPEIQNVSLANTVDLKASCHLSNKVLRSYQYDGSYSLGKLLIGAEMNFANRANQMVQWFVGNISHMFLEVSNMLRTVNTNNHCWIAAMANTEKEGHFRQLCKRNSSFESKDLLVKLIFKLPCHLS